jgi:hypothetical protein
MRTRAPGCAENRGVAVDLSARRGAQAAPEKHTPEATMDSPLVLFMGESLKGSFEASNIMKFSCLTLFGAKSDRGTPEPCSVYDESPQNLFAKRSLLISVLAPSDQLRIVVFPLICC